MFINTLNRVVIFVFLCVFEVFFEMTEIVRESICYTECLSYNYAVNALCMSTFKLKSYQHRSYHQTGTNTIFTAASLLCLFLYHHQVEENVFNAPNVDGKKITKEEKSIKLFSSSSSKFRNKKYVKIVFF